MGPRPRTPSKKRTRRQGNSTIREIKVQTEKLKPSQPNDLSELRDYLDFSQQLKVKQVAKKNNTFTLSTDGSRNIRPDLWSSGEVT